MWYLASYLAPVFLSINILMEPHFRRIVKIKRENVKKYFWSIKSSHLVLHMHSSVCVLCNYILNLDRLRVMYMND